MNYSQENRLLVIKTPLGPDVLRIERFEGQEAISGLFRFELGLVSVEGAIDPKKIVGQGVAFAVELPNHDGKYRWFHGFVRTFSYLGADDRQHHYAAEVVPWLWFLTQNTDCRVFQEKTLVDIVKSVLGEYSSDFEMQGVTGTHPTLENCVQYRESDFDFVARLLEREGLYYYFRHEETKHTMVISDSTRGYADCLESNVSWSQNMQSPDSTDEILSWEHRYEFRSGKVAHDDYNFKTPGTPLLTSTSTIVKLERNKEFELYDYPGDYPSKDVGDALAKVRMEEQERAYDVVIAKSKCRTFTPGGRFTIAAHHNPNEEGKAYVITAIRHAGTMGGTYTPGNDGGGGATYENSFTCIPDATVFRPARTTRRPQARGLHTAIVVGNAGEEIQVDEYGRIRVQFRWDRYGKLAHDASCWIRVVQPVAGSQWGFQFIPRVGHEVVVEFLEGDPDRPICTGALYHAEHMPPYKLPDNKTQSGIKTQSTPGGGGKTANEVRFEDKKGEEQIFVHGEKQLDVRVKKSAFEWVGENRHLIVKQDQLEHVENDRHETVDNNHNALVKNDHSLKVGGKQSVQVGGQHSLKVGGNVVEVFGANHSEQVTGSYFVKATGGVVIECPAGITLKCGGSSVVLDPSGVTISGPMVTIDGKMTRINSGPGSPPTPGQPGSAVAPTAPKAAQEADEADPNAVAKAKADQRNKPGTKYGPTPPKPFKRPSSAAGNMGGGAGAGADDAATKKTGWIEVQMLDETGKPVPGLAYSVQVPDGTVAEGTLDADGLARVEGFDPGNCQVSFPGLDKDAWKAK